MIKFKTIGLFLFYLVPCKLLLFGQQLLVSQELDLRSDFAYYVVPVKDEIIVVRDKALKVILQKLDSNNNWSIEREIILEGKKWNILDVFKHEENIGIVYTARMERSIRCYYSLYDVNGVWKFHRCLSDSIDISSNENLSFQFSEDKNFISVGFRDHINRPFILLYQRIQDSIYYCQQARSVFDFNHAQADEAILSNKGELYLKAIERNNIKSRIKYAPRIIGINSMGQKVIDKYIRTEWELFTSKMCIRNSKNEVYFIGLCQEPGRSNLIGYSIQNMNKSEDPIFIEFDEGKIKEWTGKKNNSIYSNNNLQLRNIKFLEDGSIIVFIESVKQYLRRPYFGNSTDAVSSYSGSRWIDYYFDDILVACFKTDGNKMWETILHKKQFSQDDDGINSSFFVMSNRSFLRILFNDEIRNESTVSEYILLADGSINRKSILNTSFKKLNLRIRDAIQLNAKTLIIPSENNGKLSLLQLFM
ncbi:MAG: hypothetical protein IT267_03910 [Saprospiraceae bacterium]|nr:hypothetical protein [Saprospiraceae bacterium]